MMQFHEDHVVVCVWAPPQPSLSLSSLSSKSCGTLFFPLSCLPAYSLYFLFSCSCNNLSFEKHIDLKEEVENISSLNFLLPFYALFKGKKKVPCPRQLITKGSARRGSEASEATGDVLKGTVAPTSATLVTITL